MNVTITGVAGVHEMLADYTAPKFPKRLQDATKAGASVFKPAVIAEARRVSRRLARSVSVRKARRELPATILTFRPSVAWFRHFIIDGTHDHGPKSAEALAFVGKSGFVVTRHVRGVKSNPIIDRVESRLESQAFAAVDRSLTASEAK